MNRCICFFLGKIHGLPSLIKTARLNKLKSTQMTMRSSRPATSTGSLQIMCSKGGTLSNNKFASTLIKKLNKVLRRNRAIHRNLQSVPTSSTLDQRFRFSHPTSSFDHSREEPESIELESLLNPPEDMVPQALWDELFDSAFEAVGDASVDIFDVK